MDENKKDLGISNYGISLTTLEDVFLKVATMGEISSSNSEEDMKKRAAELKAKLDSQKEEELDAIRVKSAFHIFRIHFWALLVKRFIYIKRDYKGLICEIFLPIAVLALGLLLTLITFVAEAPIYQVNYSMMVRDAPSSTFKVDVNSLAGTSTLFNNMNAETGNKMTLQVKNPSSLADFQQSLLGDRDPTKFVSIYMNEYNTAQHIYDYTLFLNTTLYLSPNAMANLMHQQILRQATNN